MTLSAEYIETIEQYLLSWELKYREFYDEILDHYCTDIEEKMSSGLSFDDAFEQTDQKFSKYYYGQQFGASWVSEMQHHYGPKAFEAEYVDGFRKTFRQKLRAYFFDAFRTYQVGFFCVLAMLFYYCFMNHLFTSKGMYLMIIYLPILVLYVAILGEWIKKSRKFEFKLLFLTQKKEKLDQKRSKLFSNVKLSIIQQYFMLPLVLLPIYVRPILNVIPLTNIEYSNEIKTIILTLYFIYSWVVVRLITENTKAWNLMKFKK